MAIERSSSLSAQEMETRALNNDMNLKGKWQNPQVLGQFGGLKSGTNSGATVEVSFTQPIPLSDKFSLRKEMAQVAMSMQEKQSKFFKNWVSHQAVISAWRVYISAELSRHAKERAKSLSLIKKYLETRPRVSVRQRVELSLISNLLMQLEKLGDQKVHDLEVAISDFEFWTGKKITSADLDVKLPEHYEIVADTNIDISQDIDLGQAKDQLRISSIDKEIAQKERRPDLFLGGGYRVENVAPVNHFSYAIVGLNIPLWDTGSIRAEATRARELRDQKNLQEAERKTILKHIKQLELVKLNVAQLKRFPKRIIPQNEAIIEDAEKGFKQGFLDVNIFLQAETQFYEAIESVYVAWISYLESLSSLQLMRSEALNWEKK